MSGKTEVIVTAEPRFLDFDTTCEVLGKIGKGELRPLMQADLIKCQNIGKRIVFRQAEVQRFAEFCYACSGEISSCTIGKVAGAPALAVVLRTWRSLRESTPPLESAGDLTTSSVRVGVVDQRIRVITDPRLPYIYREASGQREPNTKLARVVAPSGDIRQHAAKCLTGNTPCARHIVQRSVVDRRTGRDDRNNRDVISDFMSSARSSGLSSAPGAQITSLTILRY